MKITYTIFALLFYNCSIYAQSKFEPGYFISNDGIKTKCLIKNKDWKNNPTEIEYKISESSKSSITDIKKIQEFGIDEISKYEKHKVIIDQTNEKSKDNFQILSYDYKENDVFLKVLVEGRATLYLFESNKYRRYFFSVDNSTPEQLVYKTFQRSNSENNTLNLKNTKLEYCRKYKLQLFENINCGEITPDDIARIKFKRKSFSNFFNIYNVCKGSTSINFDASSKRDLFKITPRTGIGLADLFRSRSTSNTTNNNSEILFRIGVQLEFILPYNNDTWSFTFEPAFVTVPGSNVTGTNNPKSFSYLSLHSALGLKYSHKLTSHAKIYGLISTIPELILNSKSKTFFGESDIINNQLFLGFAYGLGVKIYKWDIEIRRQPKRAVFPYVSSNIFYSATYISIGYEIN